MMMMMMMMKTKMVRMVRRPSFILLIVVCFTLANACLGTSLKDFFPRFPEQKYASRDLPPLASLRTQKTIPFYPHQAFKDMRLLFKGRQTASASPSPPAIVPYFSSPLIFTMIHTLKSGAAFSFIYPGSMLYSSASGSDVRIDEDKPYGPPGIQTISFSTLSNPQGTFSIIEGVCRRLNTDPFDPWFDWLVIATYQGNQSCLSTAGAPVCEVWSLNMPDRGLGLTLYVANQVPYQYIISQQGKTIDSVYNYT